MVDKKTLCYFYNEGICKRIKMHCDIENMKPKSIKVCQSIKDGTYWDNEKQKTNVVDRKLSAYKRSKNDKQD